MSSTRRSPIISSNSLSSTSEIEECLERWSKLVLLSPGTFKSPLGTGFLVICGRGFFTGIGTGLDLTFDELVYVMFKLSRRPDEPVDAVDALGDRCIR